MHDAEHYEKEALAEVRFSAPLAQVYAILALAAATQAGNPNVEQTLDRIDDRLNTLVSHPIMVERYDR